MIINKIAIFGFFLTISNSDVTGYTMIEPLSDWDDPDVCDSQECNGAASTILKNMDPTVHPCIDFYKFACGGFIEKEIVPEHLESYNMHEITKTNINLDLKKLIVSDELKWFYPIFNQFYKICVNPDANRYETLLELMNTLDGWPLVVGDKWNENQGDWIDLMSKFRDFGDIPNYFVNYFADTVFNKTKTVKLLIQAPYTETRNELNNYVVDKSMDDLPTILNLTRELGVDLSYAVRELSKTYTFETALYNIIPSREEQSGFALPEMSFAQLEALNTPVRWKDIVNSILPSYENIDYSDIVIVTDATYIGKLVSLISETPKSVVANYVFRKFLTRANRLIEIPKYPSKKPRWEQCIENFKRELPLTTYGLYLDKYVTDELRSDVTEIITEIRHQMNDTFKKALWINEDTRNAAIAKVTAMKVDVDYLDPRDGDFRNEDYPLGVFGSYVEASNTVGIRAGLLRDIFYGNDRPDYLNYGAFGSLIGHEIAHGFEADTFEKWLDTTTTQKYVERVRCISEQYSNYMPDRIEEKVPYSDETIEEIIADNIGVRLAYEAYVRKSMTESPTLTFDEPPLHALEEYSPRQMFWISYANQWCEKIPEKNVLGRRRSDAHPFADYRVIGPLSNMKEFAKDFECSKFLKTTTLVSRMIPEKRCPLL